MLPQRLLAELSKILDMEMLISQPATPGIRTQPLSWHGWHLPHGSARRMGMWRWVEWVHTEHAVFTQYCLGLLSWRSYEFPGILKQSQFAFIICTHRQSALNPIFYWASQRLIVLEDKARWTIINLIGSQCSFYSNLDTIVVILTHCDNYDDKTNW